MKRAKQAVVWFFSFIFSGLYSIVAYPFFILKNIGYHLRSPSVLFYAVLLFALDRYSKLLVLDYSNLLPVEIIKDFFSLAFVKNPGVAFGWFPDCRLPPIIMALTMVIIITYYSLKLPEEERLTRWALALLVGGAIGNLYDRIMYGFVVDFFLFRFGSFDFPVFNVADIAIDLGVFMLFVDIFFLSSSEEPEPVGAECAA